MVKQPAFGPPPTPEQDQVQAPELSFYLLKHGQKIGPFSAHDIQHQLNAQIISYTDLLSHDKHASPENWKRIMEWEQFRTLAGRNSQELPPPPEDELLEQIAHNENAPGRHETAMETMANLAFIGSISNQGQKQRGKIRSLGHTEKSQAENKHQYLGQLSVQAVNRSPDAITHALEQQKYKRAAVACLSLILVAGILYFSGHTLLQMFKANQTPTVQTQQAVVNPATPAATKPAATGRLGEMFQRPRISADTKLAPMGKQVSSRAFEKVIQRSLKDAQRHRARAEKSAQARAFRPKGQSFDHAMAQSGYDVNPAVDNAEDDRGPAQESSAEAIDGDDEAATSADSDAPQITHSRADDGADVEEAPVFTPPPGPPGQGDEAADESASGADEE